MKKIQELNILFDARHIENIYSGLGRYTFSVLEALAKMETGGLEVILDSNVSYSENPLFLKLSSYVNIKLKYIDAPLYKIKHHFVVSDYVNKSSCDVYFYPHFDSPIFIKNKKIIFVIHDLLPLIVEDYLVNFKVLKKVYFKLICKINLIKKKTNCIAVSNSTKRDILDHISNDSEKIKVVYEDKFEISIKSKSPNKYVNKITSLNFLFYIGDRRPHKNLMRMVKVFNILKNQYNYDGHLIIAGSEKNFNFDLESYVKENEHIKLIGKVSDEELDILYSKMQGLFFISKYEGFGLPILEAAKYNKPIITSNNSSCIEISPPSALFIDNKSSDESIAEKCIAYINDKTVINNTEYLKKFSWDKSVKEIFEIS